MLTSGNNILHVFTLLKYIRTGGMKPFRYSIIILGISTIYFLLADYIIAKILFDHMSLFGNSGTTVTIAEKIVLIATLFVFIVLAAGAVMIGKRMLAVWNTKACITTLLSVFAGLPISLLLFFVYSVLH